MNSSVVTLHILLVIAYCNKELLQPIASTPPRGWNSYQCYSNPNETEILQTGEAMSSFLLPFGYDYLVIDAGWYADLETGKGLIIDEYGRLQPDPLRYPSSTNNQGFKQLSAKLSTMGLKLGIHVMKGISIAAIDANTPVYGTNNEIFAKDIANMSDVCPWWNQFYGLNMSADGAQQYIDSLYSQYIREWNISFIKNDCIFGKDYTPTQIIAVSNTINKYTKDDDEHNVVYSLSPGFASIAPSQEAQHIHEYVNQYRITDDNWDYYKNVLRPFNISSQYALSGLYNSSGLDGRSWIDLDIMAFGYMLSHNNRDKADVPTSLSYGEQRCEMTLWCITRSSLMFGGLLTQFVSNPNNTFNNFTLNLITNQYALNVNAYSNNNKQISASYNSRGYITTSVWYADLLSSSQYFVAMFNLQMVNNYKFNVSLNQLNMNHFKQCNLFDIWNNKNIGSTVDGFVVENVPYHDVAFLLLSNCN